MRRPDRRALFGAGLLMFTPAPGRPAPSATTTPAPWVETYANLPVARLTEWLRPRPGEAVEARVRRLERELRRMELRTLPPSAAAAVAGALRAMDYADEWEDAASVETEWSVVTPHVDEISTGGQKYLPLADGSFLAQGYAPTKHRVKMTVDTVVKGSQYNDLCISEIRAK